MSKVVYDYDKAIELYKSGMTAKDIGEQLGVNYQTIIANLKRAGVYVVKPRNSSDKGKKKTNKSTCAVSSLTSINNLNSSSNIIIESNNNKKKSKKKSTNSKKKTSSIRNNVVNEIDNDVKKDDIKVSRKEKIAYCNKVYGEGNWEFMPLDEVIDRLVFDNKFRKRLVNIK